MPKLKQMDGSLYEAALDLGASPFTALFKVVIPEILPGIISGFMMAITLSLDDYIISAYTKPAGFDTISTYVYGAMAKSNANSSLPALRALSAIIFIAIILIVLITNFASRKKEA
jgi:spermidine/putrescine transport system permease protein